MSLPYTNVIVLFTIECENAPSFNEGHTTPSLNAFDRTGCLVDFDAFLPLHDQEIERLHPLPKPQLYSMGV
ncbi:hypothetical protein [Aneurinibacillus tyrosinisolvens]|uniref:hypothetical protein n=1 Tax=Aneurinibacillus tyrosinisolvens TaxID=1443435 RepID=UPI00128E7865|nr:hypothetical protein [Aneurinibacillus tyrosinisolvens]